MAEEIKETFSPEKHLTEIERIQFSFVKDRIEKLKKTKENVLGKNLENIWREADAKYVPSRVGSKGKKVFASDEEKGWASPMVTIGKETDWQSDIAQPNPFVKLQIALSILIDRNPEGVLSPNGSKFENTTNLIKQLYQRSWEIGKSKQQLKLFVFNLAKYGWAIARTYPLKISRTVKELISYNEEKPEKSEWKEKEVVEYNDVFRENLDPFTAWIDDMTKPNNEFSMRDWTWEKIMAFDSAKEEFGNYEKFAFVKPITIEEEKDKEGKKVYQETEMVKVKFYENRIRDIYMVIMNDIPVVIEPLPISDFNGTKKLSCWQTYWLLRHGECPFGIGLYEAMRYNSALYDRVVNMTIDQLVLAIYKMFFYGSSETLSETGEIKITPGKGKQLSNPKDITWLEVPGPGMEAWKGIEFLKSCLDEASGVGAPLLGEIVGKTAFETAQAKESALKRLKAPLDNISEALEQDGYITISLMQMIYSVPEVFTISNPDLIDKYLKEIKGDSELYERVENENGSSDFKAKVYREFQLNLDKDEKGNLIESKESRFFRIKPKYLKWDGVIKIKGQSVLSPSKELTKVIDLEMINVLGPMLQGIGLEIQNGADLDNTTMGKVAKNVLKIYDKDPKEWMPNAWFEERKPVEQPLMIPAGGMGGGQQNNSLPNQLPAQNEKLVPSVNVNKGQGGVMSKLMNKLTSSLRLGQ